MRYFSGFGFKDEAKLFSDWLPGGDTVVAGFSYGAQQAVEYAVTSPKRIDRLILLSPAFFHDKDEAFIQDQLDAYRCDSEAYAKAFYRNVRYPSRIDITPYAYKTNVEDLQTLLTYRWDETKLRDIVSRGTTIEVVLGGCDRIIDAQAACAFFTHLATTYLIKEAGHLLRRKDGDGV